MKYLFAVAAGLLCLGSCSRRDAIVVGSKNFTEQVILGEIAAQQIERKCHLVVERRLDLGGTLLAHEALNKGEIDLYPEYTGTALSSVLKRPIPADSATVYMQVKDDYRDRFHLIWLPPLGFNDTFAMVVRKQDGQRLAQQNLSSAEGRPWRLGVGYEFLTRPDGLARLNKIYGLRWQGTPQTMDLGLLYRALQQKKIDMAAANSTDGVLTEPQYVALADDKRAFPPYNACFVVRAQALDQHPEVRVALTMLSNHIGDDVMRSLNRRVDVQHERVEQVVRDFLATQP